jgi:hypothetical protein
VSNASIHALVYGVIGLILTLAGSLMINNLREFRRIAHRTQGRVVKLRTSYPRTNTVRRRGHSRSRRRPTPVYYPTLSFTTGDGRSIVAESNFASNPPAGRPGSVVPILYDPDNPARVRIDNPRGAGMLPGGILLGAGLLIVSLSVSIAISQ